MTLPLTAGPAKTDPEKIVAQSAASAEMCESFLSVKFFISSIFLMSYQATIMLVALSLEATATGNLPGAGLLVEVAMLKKLDTRFTVSFRQPSKISP